MRDGPGSECNFVGRFRGDLNCAVGIDMLPIATVGTGDFEIESLVDCPPIRLCENFDGDAAFATPL